MVGAIKVVKGHDDIYEASEAGGVTGGQLVVPVAAPTEQEHSSVQAIAPAGDGAANVLGVAARTALPLSEQNQTGTDADGYPVTYANPINSLTAVYKQAVVPVTYTAAAVGFGERLVAAANGEVRAYDSVGGDTPDLIVGECRVVGGMGAAGGVGKAFIY